MIVKEVTAMSDFFELYKRPEWQRKRLEVMEAARFECENCGEKERTLNVHHKFYVKGRKPWEYDDEDLTCLCEPCHKEQTAKINQLKVITGRLPLQLFEQVLGFAKLAEIETHNGGDFTLDSYDEVVGAVRFMGFPNLPRAVSRIIGECGGDNEPLTWFRLNEILGEEFALEEAGVEAR